MVDNEAQDDEIVEMEEDGEDELRNKQKIEIITMIVKQKVKVKPKVDLSLWLTGVSW